MRLQIQSDKGVTLVENTFIDRFMPTANGEFVKLYIYLLRCAGSGRELSISSIADFFDHTEKDVSRALAYWEKLGLLKIEYDASGAVNAIILMETGSGANGPAPQTCTQENTVKAEPVSPVSAVPATKPVSDPVISEPEIPSKHSISAARRRELKNQEEIRELIFVAETLFGRPLGPTESSNLLYFYDGLHFSCELIEYLIEYCAGKGDPGTRYMEKIALDWYSKNIRTVQQAKEDSLRFNSDYFQILGFLGIKGRNPIDKETEYMNRWINTWQLPLDLIKEACSRTVMQTSQPSIQYADSILKSWHDANAMTLQDVAVLDEAHGRGQSGAQNTRLRSASEKSERTPGRLDHSRNTSRNRFNNFQQRDYDYASLEQQLLQAQARKEG